MDTSNALDLAGLIRKAAHDGRLNTSHMSIYIALLNCWLEQGYPQKFTITRKKLMELAKIGAISTYHRSIKQLIAYGYIVYIPTYDHYTGTKVSLTSCQ